MSQLQVLFLHQLNFIKNKFVLILRAKHKVLLMFVTNQEKKNGIKTLYWCSALLKETITLHQINFMKLCYGNFAKLPELEKYYKNRHTCRIMRLDTVNNVRNSLQNLML